MNKIKRKAKNSGGGMLNFQKRLLAWYDENRRILPWRAKKGQKADPYRVWLSEIMLQQTTVAAVIPYFIKFVKKWPDVESLAKAPREDVMREWAGLGYYARARNLHACARIAANDLKGDFPEDEKALLKLPGIGAYTAAAIRAIAFNKPAVVVDGNVERIAARYYSVSEPLPDSKPRLKRLAEKFYGGCEDRPGDLAQALMDLGASICAPAKPACGACPVSENCAGRIKKTASGLPVKRDKVRPKKYGNVYWITDRKGRVLIERRKDDGLLGGMPGLPTSVWDESPDKIIDPAFLTAQPVAVQGGYVRHVFTHFELALTPKRVSYSGAAPKGYVWLDKVEAERVGMPTVFRKAMKIFTGLK